jgi:hypothetical protein
MYRIERTPYGFRIRFMGEPAQSVMKDWMNEATSALSDMGEDFGVVVDLREVPGLPEALHCGLTEGMRLFKTRGMLRSAVLVSRPVLKRRLEHVARETRVFRWERYFEGAHPGCERDAVDWVQRGIDPEWRL